MLKRLIAGILVVFTALALPAQSQAAGLGDPRDAMKVFVEATAKGDADAIAALFTPNAILLLPGTPIINGRDAIRAVYAKNFAAGKNTIEFGNNSLDMSGNRGVILWHWRIQIERASGEPLRFVGRSLVYFVKTDEGWLISADMAQTGG